MTRSSGAPAVRVLVVGAGITGVTTAYSLSRLGFSVVVVDRHPYPAMETSYANGGQLSASNAEVWNSWSTLWKGMQWMLKADAPLLLNPAFTLHKYSWLAEFVGSIRQYRANTLETTRLAIAARKHLFEIAERERIDFDLQRRGILHLYHEREAFDAAARSNEILREAGLDRRAVTPEEMFRIEPTLHGKFYGGFFTPSDSSGDIHKFTRGLAEACVRLGVTFRMNAIVTRVDRGYSVHVRDSETDAAMPPVDADLIVVCGGVHSRALAAQFGDRLNIYPVKGYSITVCLNDASSQQGAPTVSLLDESAKIVTSRLGEDRFRVAGTAELNGYNRDIRFDRIEPLIRWTRRLFPGVSTREVVPWAGLRPMTPNMMPRVCRSKCERVYYNTGHGHLGWTLSPVTAAMISEAILADLK